MEDSDTAACFLYVQRESFLLALGHYGAYAIHGATMTKFILVCMLLPLLGSCHHKEEEYELLYIPELNDNEFVILTTDDEEELEKFGIVYEMRRR